MAQTTSIRSALNEQLLRLQGKHNAELELLEDMRQFTRQRSVLEKQYSESMHRLVTQFVSKREILKPVDVSGFERQENRGLMEVWKALLEKTDDLSKRKLTISELLITQVSDVMKQQKRVKETNYKRLIEICQKMNSEILESTKELAISKKSYGEVEKVCEDARSKYTEAENRLKKRDVKFFESFATLEKNYKKISDRLKSCQKRTICSRNDYLLAVATTNAHLKRHGSKDLPQLMEALDGEMYDVVRRAYSSYAQLESDAAVFVKAEFDDLAEQANFVNRDYVLESFLQQHPCLRVIHEHKFEPYGQDTVTAMSRDHGAEIFLDKDARKWANKLTKDQAAITAIQKQVKGLQSVTSAYAKNPEFGTSESYTEAMQNIEQLLEEQRQLEVQVTKAEARLEALRQAGIDVNKWLQKAESIQRDNTTSGNELTPNMHHGRVSQLSLPSSIGGSQDFDVETSSINSGQLGPDDTTSMSSNWSESLPKRCKALYDYTAQRPDELDIVEGEELEVLEWDDGDGWCKGKNSGSREGYFPQSYVQPISRPTSPTASTGTTNPPSTCSHQMSVSSTTSTLTVTSLSLSPAHSHTNGTSGDVLLKAVYDYTAQYEEELSFPEGAIIKLLRTDENGVDDGWWEGSYQGTVGVFPSVVVEIITNGTMSPGMNSTLLADPLFHPPPPMESPPPLPPDCLPLSSSSPQVESRDLGPSAKVINDCTYNSPRVTPVNRSSEWLEKVATPSLRIDTASPSGDQQGRWRIDSFDDYDGDESMV